MALTALDFPFCFLAVRMIGTDTIGHYEQVVVGALKSVLQVPFPDLFKQKENEASADGTAREGDLNIADDIEEAEAANHEEGACTKPHRKNSYNALTIYTSHLDPAWPGLCDPQIVHLHSSSDHSRYHAQGCQDVEGLGMEHWQAEAKITKTMRVIRMLSDQPPVTKGFSRTWV
jgi:hypothetical protein